MKKNFAKAALLVSVVCGLSACASFTPISSDYNGEVVISKPIRTKHNCSLNVITTNGSEVLVNVGAAMECNGKEKGDVVNIVNGKYSK